MRLGLFAACGLWAATSAAAAPASYRFSAIADLDGNASTGCSIDSVAGAPTGSELRISAASDRTQITERVLEICRDGSWQVAMRDATPQPLAAGQGPAGSDLLAWSVPRPWFAAYVRLPLRVYAERVDVPAVDALSAGGQWLTLDLALFDASRMVPALALPGLLLLTALLLYLGQKHLTLGNPVQRSALSAALLLLTWATVQLPADAEGPRFDSVRAEDVGNDVSDAGADLLQVEVSSSADAVKFRVAVNHIEDEGVGNPARVLFIGNSLTYSHDMPTMLQAIALQAGKQLTADAITLPGAALEDHYRGRTAHAALADGHYQVVIMQQGPSSLPESQDNLREWTARFNTRIRAGGARPALYMVWPDASRSAFFDAVHDSYSNAALDVDGMFIPAGEAWRLAWHEDPDLPLYDSDLFHPSALGAYAAALSIFTELYRQSPLGLPAQLTLEDGRILVFPETQAREVQAAAWAAHRQFGRPGA
jgi:hypothetical protein